MTENEKKAFMAGFEEGNSFGMTDGLRIVAKAFAQIKDTSPDFPPELISSFATMMHEEAGNIGVSVKRGLKKIKEEGEHNV